MVLAAAGLPLLAPIAARAAPGDLDQTWGDRGKVRTKFPGVGLARANDLVVQRDGKVVAVGATESVPRAIDFAVARYLNDGSLDPSFAGTGQLVTDTSSGGFDSASAVAVQPDDKLVVAGISHLPGGTDRQRTVFAVARYLPNGLLDPGFAGTGFTTTSFPVPPGTAPGSTTFTTSSPAMAMQQDGKIVLADAGCIDHGSKTCGLVAMARYTTSGALDPTFGTGGRVFSTTPGISGVGGLVIQADGKLVIAGQAEESAQTLLARFTPSGSLDTSFGTGGSVQSDVGQFYALEQQGDGRLVAAGELAGGTNIVRRYSAHGVVDTSFGTGGTAGTAGVSVSDLAIDYAGRVVLAGYVRLGSVSNFGVVRVTPSGGLDASFGNNGRVITDFDDIAEQDAGASGVAVYPAADPNGNAGKVAAAGYAKAAEVIVGGVNPPVLGLGEDFALARYMDQPTFLPTVSVSDFSLSEGNVGPRQFTFILSVAPAPVTNVSVNYATVDGSAVAGTDYGARSGTATIAAGSTTAVVEVPVSGDLTPEGHEDFFVNLSAPVGAVVGDAQGRGLITNDDAPRVVISDTSVVEGDAGSANAVFTVTASAPTVNTVSVNYTTSNGTATAGSDYAASTGSVAIPPGATSTTISVPVNGDVLDEVDETFFVTINNNTNPTTATIDDTKAQATIFDNDGARPKPTLSITDVTQAEANAGSRPFAFTVALSGPSGRPITVNYATANGTATAGSDYSVATGTLTIAAGATSGVINVSVPGDLTGEAHETFFVNLSAPTNATLADAQGIGTILNDDAPRVVISNAQVIEGGPGGTTKAVFTVTMSVPTVSTVSIAYSTANGTATAGSDYTEASGSVVFNPGETSKTIEITVIGDETVEPDEVFFVNISTLTTPTAAFIDDTRGDGTIFNDD